MSFKQILRKVALDQGFMIDRAIADQNTVDILERFRPRDTGHDLIRLGGDGDGGYLVPNDLEEISACFSPGVSTTADFEAALLDIHSIPSFLADFSVDSPPPKCKNFDFEKKFLGGSEDEKYMRLQTWVERKLPDDGGDLILQMDIEGAEYEVLFDTPQAILERFRVIVVEFHNLKTIFDMYGRLIIDAAVRKLSHSFVVAHLHPNNCDDAYTFSGITVPNVLEVTFLRKDRVCAARQAIVIPHPLDRKNTLDRPDISLSKHWF